MNNTDRMRIRYAQLQWFRNGKAAGEPWPPSPPDSLRLWTPKHIWEQQKHGHHSDSTVLNTSSHGEPASPEIGTLRTHRE
ncbi:hypothetical protein CspHIS471_0108590 [Cutaneotrichosporon sp. HIS471]|nr:hypothetical protein CspHIS471_0108590 [Cutaneotrichosporon sp. HIS471]